MHAEDDLIMLSALQHFVFCRRQCALIHIEQVWTENRLTVEGNLMHERVHEIGYESRGEVRIEHGVPLRSLRLGLIGKADIVEFHRLPDNRWLPFPVEYKHGKPKPDDSDKIQLCAQALCLEEMLDINIPDGAIFYGKTRRRFEVIFDNNLVQVTEGIARKAYGLIKSGVTPPAEYTKRCENCSLISQCLPKPLQAKHSAKRFLSRIYKEK